jgi:hypothetical protein
MRGPLVYFAVVLTTAIAPAQTTEEQFSQLAWDTSHAGSALDLSAYHKTFSDEFKSLSVTADGGPGPWYAPVHGPFGTGRFVPPGAAGPFAVAKEGLAIRAEKSDGRLQSGLMQTVDGRGHGFAQKYGYFEMTAELPAGPGGWPAFWLLSQNGFTDKTATRTEVDVVEWYGGDPKGHHASIHLWPAADPLPGAVTTHVYHSAYSKIKSARRNGQLEGFHSYGACIGADWVIFYFDRKELGRFKTVPEFGTPLYMVVDLAIFEGEADSAASPRRC